MNLLKRMLPDVVAIVVFAVISFAYFCPAVTEGRILSQHDSVAGIGAGQEAKEYLERTGERTRWTNSLFGGMPTYQVSPSYDSTNLLKVVENVYHLYLSTYVWYVFVMLLGFYILLRAFDFKAWMAGLGAIIWAFSSYFFIIIAAGHIWKFITLAYIPPTIADIVQSRTDDLLFLVRHALYGHCLWCEGVSRKREGELLESNWCFADSRCCGYLCQSFQSISYL